jgi:phosphatidylinositol alpha 1,6-mannosyltransferase
VLRLLEHLKSEGHQALIVAPSGSVDEYQGFPVIKMPSLHLKRFGDIRVALPINKINSQIFDFQPDVIHLASPALMGFYVARRADFMNIPTVGIFQTDLAGFAKHYGFGLTQSAIWRWVSRIHRTVDRTLAPSRRSCQDLRDLSVTNVYLWQRGVNTELFNPMRRQKNKWNTEKRIVGFVGRLANEKRVHDLVTLSKREDIQLVIVGDGPARAELETLMPSAIFTGFLGGQELAETLASFDCFVHTGPNETFCQAVQEALASGVPTIAVNQGGPLDLVKHGETGYLIDTADKSELHNAVNRILHPANWSKFASAAHLSVVDRSWKSVMDQLMNHYQEVIAYRAELDQLEEVVA